MTSPRELGDESFVSLTTFRKSGEPVSTPLWIVPRPDGVAFWTPTASGKVKRLRNNGAVELRPCDRRGRVPDGAPTVSGQAVLRDDARTLGDVESGLAAKYGLQYRLVRLFERLRPSFKDRVVIDVS